MSCERTLEAVRLIRTAQALLDRPEEEIVANYLDHAVEALQIVSNGPGDALPAKPSDRPIAPTMAPAEGLG